MKEVRFIGNAHVPGGDLHAVMQTREGGYLSFLTGAAPTARTRSSATSRRIQAVYFDRGYVNVKVGKPAVALSPDRRFIYVTIPIEEGEQYTDRQDRLLRAAPRPGAAAAACCSSRGAARSSPLQASRRTSSRSATSTATWATPTRTSRPLTQLDPEAADRRPHLRGPARARRSASSGSRSSGNDKTRDKVIRRELRIYEGELYSGTGMRDVASSA